MVHGPMAQGFFDIARLIGKGVLFSSSGKSAKTLSRAERKAQGAVDTARLRREELAGLGVLLAFVALPVALYAAHALDLGKGGVSIERLTSSDAAAFEVAIFGGPPWLIECTAAGASAVLREAAASARELLPDGLRVATLDCGGDLPSGGTVRKRLGLARKPPAAGLPQLLLASSGLPPRALPADALRSAAALGRHLKRTPLLSVVPVNTTAQLSRYCLRRELCLLLLTTGAPRAEHRGAVEKELRRPPFAAAAASVDRATHAISLGKQLPETDRPQVVALRRGAAGKVEARALQGALGAAALAGFVEQLRENKPPLKPLAKELAISRIDGKADADDPPVTTVL